MPDARLQRTRDAYDRSGDWRDWLDALPPMPVRPYQVVTDPTTGVTSRVCAPLRFTPSLYGCPICLRGTGLPADPTFRCGLCHGTGVPSQGVTANVIEGETHG